MTIVVVGAGAIGQLVAGQLASTAHRTILLARPRIATALEHEPVRILQAGTLRRADQLTIMTDPLALSALDAHPELAIVCVKSYDTPGVLATLAALNVQSILTLQNGLGNEEMLAERFGADRIVSGAITISVEVAVTGCVEVVKQGGIGLAPVGVGAQPATNAALAMLRAAGFDMHTFNDYRSLKWSKALLNMLGNATSAILDLPVTKIYADPHLIAIERRVVLEALDVMSRLGISPVNLPRYPSALLAQALRWLPAPVLNPILRYKIAGGRGGKLPSLQIELARGNRRSEGAFLYGAVAQAGAEVGVDTPVNRALWDILQSLVSGQVAWDVYRHQPAQLLEAIARRSSALLDINR